jgi:hypothetical protein
LSWGWRTGAFGGPADPREILAKRLHLQAVTRLFAKQYCITMRVLLGAGIGEVLMMAIRASLKVKSRFLAKVRLGTTGVVAERLAITNHQEGP